MTLMRASTHLGGDGLEARSPASHRFSRRADKHITSLWFVAIAGDVGVVDGPNGKYLRTYADGKWNDNLLALPECA